MTVQPAAYNDSITTWKVFETYVPGRIRTLGVSNSTLPMLKEHYDAATSDPK